MKRTDRAKDDTHSVVGEGSGCGERVVWRGTALYQALRAYIIRVKLDSVDQSGPCIFVPLTPCKYSTTIYTSLQHTMRYRIHPRPISLKNHIPSKLPHLKPPYNA